MTSLNNILKSRQYTALIDAGLKMVSTDRQIANGSVALTGKIGRGRRAVTANYVVTANGAVLSNDFVARRVYGDTISAQYKNGFAAIQELMEKRKVALTRT
jgi:hypothetical protein